MPGIVEYFFHVGTWKVIAPPALKIIKAMRAITKRMLLFCCLALGIMADPVTDPRSVSPPPCSLNGQKQSDGTCECAKVLYPLEEKGDPFLVMKHI